MIELRLSVNVGILPSLYFQMFHHAMYMHNDHHLYNCFMHMYNCYRFYILAQIRVYHVEGIFATAHAALTTSFFL